MRILSLSDIHGHGQKLKDIVKKETAVDLIIIAGDLTHAGGYEEARTLLLPMVNNNLQMVAVPGNMDKGGVLEFFKQNKINLHGNGKIIKGFGFFGIGGGNLSPLNTPFEIDDIEIEKLLDNAYKDVRRARKKILISHVPPKNTNLDIISSGSHVGSHIIRSFIERNSIDLCLCGHIHEAAGQEKIKNTLCVNGGAVRNGQYCIIDITENDISVERIKI